MEKKVSTCAPVSLAPSATRWASAALLPFLRGLPMTTMIFRGMIHLRMQ